MSIIMISDLHLEEARPDITAIFLNFLKNEAMRAEALYILGDFFEVWIGDDNLTDFNRSIIAALKQATQQGLPIYMMHGNRDFLLGKSFFKATGCHILPDEYILNLYGRPTLLMHGDTLCTLDVKYLKFRKKARHWLVQKLFLFKSLEKRRQIAHEYRNASKKHISTLADNIMDVTQLEVERVMNLHKVQHLIHGHTHREGQHYFQLNQVDAQRTVLGAWHERGNALICKPNGEQETIMLS